MKQLYKVILAVATVIPALVSCNKVEEKNSEPEKLVRTVQFSAGEVTKTVFGTPSGTKIPTLWTDEKTVGISLNLASVKQSTTPVVSNGGATATFSADIVDSGSSPYTFYAVSPYSSVVSVNDSYKSIQVEIPASQTPLATSVDEAAQILVAQYAAGATFPASSVAMDFAHLTAYGKISFSNLALTGGEAIVSVSLTADENWAGRYYYYVEDHDPYSAGDLVANPGSKTITLTTSSSTDIWFACAPVDLGGKKVKVVISTDEGNTYTKRITIPDGKTFASGQVNAFTINMNGIEPDGPVQYDLVTNPAELTEGSQVIIAAPGTTAIAMSTTQNSNNRGQTSVTKANEGAAITSPSDAVQIFTIEEGNVENTIAFNTGDGYIYAASSGSNYLRTEANLSDNSSWTVSINSETGNATVIAQGTNERNKMRYNSGSNIFSCYASDSSTGTPVAIYILSADWELESIAVTTNPEKTTYEAGEDFDATGMVVTAHYVDADDNTHTKNVVLNNAELTIEPSTDLEEGTTSVSISYGGKSTTQAITVTAPITWDLKSIAVATAPTKITYTEGENFDPTGLVVTATYENHDNTEQTKQETVDNSDLTFSPTTSTALTASDTAITITYNGKSTSQAITVNALYAITIDDSIENGSVEADKSSAIAGATVNLTPSPASGYTLDEWNVYKTGDSSTKVTVTNNAFTMPAYPVTVSASFKAGSSSSTTILTTANILEGSGGGSQQTTGYRSVSFTDDNSFVYNAYAISTYHSKATNTQGYIQIKAYANSTAYYIDLPELGSKITSIKMTVSATNKSMDGGSNTATLYFSASNSTSSTGTGVASGTGTSSITIDCSSLNLNTGYITAGGAVRIWDIEITYDNN